MQRIEAAPTDPPSWSRSALDTSVISSVKTEKLDVKKPTAKNCEGFSMKKPPGGVSRNYHINRTRGKIVYILNFKDDLTSTFNLKPILRYDESHLDRE